MFAAIKQLREACIIISQIIKTEPKTEEQNKFVHRPIRRITRTRCYEQKALMFIGVLGENLLTI